MGEGWEGLMFSPSSRHPPDRQTAADHPVNRFVLETSGNTGRVVLILPTPKPSIGVHQIAAGRVFARPQASCANRRLAF
jgi:hypothetical protein